jgi:excisionase family DNA binding protein
MTRASPQQPHGDHGDGHPEPLSVRIPAAVRLTGISRSRLYLLIQAGDLEIVKIGRSTLIPYRALKELVKG